MRAMIHGAATLVAFLALTGAAPAQPLVATFTGFVSGTTDPFTAIFRYDTEDVQPSPFAIGFLDAIDGTLQSASYTDPFRSLTFTTPGSFSEGRYDSTVFGEDGTVVEVDTVATYALSSRTGTVSLTFGGVNDAGLVTFDSSGLDYAILEPTSFALSRDTVATVPLPSSGVLLVCALALFGVRQRRGRTCSHSAHM